MTFTTDQEERSEERKEEINNTPLASSFTEEPVDDLAENRRSHLHTFPPQQATAGQAAALPRPIIISTHQNIHPETNSAAQVCLDRIDCRIQFPSYNNSWG